MGHYNPECNIKEYVWFYVISCFSPKDTVILNVFLCVGYGVWVITIVYILKYLSKLPKNIGND